MHTTAPGHARDGSDSSTSNLMDDLASSRPRLSTASRRYPVLSASSDRGLFMTLASTFWPSSIAVTCFQTLM